MSESEAVEAEGVVEVEEADPELLKEMDEMVDFDYPPSKKEETPEPEKEEEKGEKEEESAEKPESEESDKGEEDKGEGEVVERDEEVEGEVEREEEQVEETPGTTTAGLSAQLEESRKQNAELREMVTDLLAAKKEAEPEAEPVEERIEDFDFFDGEEVSEEVFEPAKLKEVLNRQANRIYRAAVEQSIRRVPALVESQIVEVMNVRRAYEQFYENNPDLRGYEEDLRKIADVVANEDPNMSVGDMFSETARRFRMYKGMPPPSGRDDKPPTSPKAPAARTTTTKTRPKDEGKKPRISKAEQELFDEMDAMNWDKTEM